MQRFLFSVAFEIIIQIAVKINNKYNISNAQVFIHFDKTDNK